MNHYFRNAAGSRIGYTRRVGPKIVGYLMNGSRVGYYYPPMDITYSPGGSRVGYGNLLGALILENA